MIRIQDAVAKHLLIIRIMARILSQINEVVGNFIQDIIAS